VLKEVRVPNAVVMEKPEMFGDFGAPYMGESTDNRNIREWEKMENRT